MPKMMPKFDAENESQNDDFGCHFDYPDGRWEVRRASLRRRRRRHAGLFSLKRLTPAGVGGFCDPWIIGNRSKNELSRIDGHFDAGGVGKKHETLTKNRYKNEARKNDAKMSPN